MVFRSAREWGEKKRHEQRERACAHLRSIGLDAHVVRGNQAEKNVGFRRESSRFSVGDGRIWSYLDPSIRFIEFIEIRSSLIRWVTEITELIGGDPDGPAYRSYIVLLIPASLGTTNIGYVEIKPVPKRSPRMIGPVVGFRWKGKYADDIIRLLNEDEFLGQDMITLKVHVKIRSCDRHWAILLERLPRSRQEWDCYERIARHLLEVTERYQF